MSPVEVKGEATLAATEVIVGRLAAGEPLVVGTKTTTPLNGDPVAIPAELVSVIRPVEVKALLPAVEVIVGRPVVGITTTTPLKGAPVALPTELVGVIRPVEVKGVVPETKVIVGRPVEGTTTSTPLNGEAVAPPAESVGVMRPVDVKAVFPDVIVMVGRLAAGEPPLALIPPLGRPEPLRPEAPGVPLALEAPGPGETRAVPGMGTIPPLGRPDGGRKTMTPLSDAPIVMPAASVAGIRTVVVKGDTTPLTIEVMVGRFAAGEEPPLAAPPLRLWPGTPGVLEAGAEPVLGGWGSQTMTPLTGEPVAIPAELVGVTRPVVVIGNGRPKRNEVTVSKPPPGALLAPGIEALTAVAGSYTMTALYGDPVGMPAELVGVMRPVVVMGDARLLANEVTVGRTPLGAPLGPTFDADDGSRTMTPLNGDPVAIPAELVGVMSPVVVIGEAIVPTKDVTVGKPVPEAPLEPAFNADEGNRIMTPLNGDPVAIPAELVGVIRPVVVIGEATVPTKDVTVGKPALGAPLEPAFNAEDNGSRTITPLNGEPVGTPAELVGVIRPNVVMGETTLLT